MTATVSRIPNFYKYSVSNRLQLLYERGVLSESEYHSLMDGKHMLNADTANRLVENVISTFSLAMGLGLNFMVNDREHLVPMVVEEPSIIAAVSSAAKIVRQAGGFQSSCDEMMLIGQIQVLKVPHMARAQQAILQNKEEILNLANSLHPKMQARGGGAKDLEVKLHSSPGESGDMLVVHLIVDTCNAMGANLVNTMCEGVAPLVEKITSGEVFLRILSNLTDRAIVHASATIPTELLSNGDYSGEHVRDAIIAATEFAAIDPYRAATHNKGIMNGIDAVAIATGNDWRAIEAAAHAYAARDGHYTSLTRWFKGPGGELVGQINIPLKVGTVGGQVESNQTVGIAHRIMEIDSARHLAEIMASVGLAQNFAALKALGTEGIQRGHMTLHARSVAAAAGAEDQHFEEVVDRLVRSGEIKIWRAREIIMELKDEGKRTQLATAQPAQRESATLAETTTEDSGNAFRGAGYGKIILLGEHSVVYGQPAIAAPIPLRILADAQPQLKGIDFFIPRWGVELEVHKPTSADNSLHRSVKLITERLGVQDQGMRIEVSPHVPRSVGLGSSAALAVAVIRSIVRCFDLSLSDKAICDIAYDCEKIAHGTPSGIDNTIATYGNMVIFSTGTPPIIEPITLARSIPVVIGLSGVRTLTAKTVATVREAWERNPKRYERLFTHIGDLTREAAQAITKGDLHELGELMNLNHALLNSLLISNWQIEELVQVAREKGALGAKMTGGGGGAVIAIAEENNVRKIATAMRERGYQAYVTEISGQIGG